MGNIHSELKKMTTGIFGKKHYRPSLILAENTLKEFENLKIFSSFQPNESKVRFIGNYMKRHVS
jgi:hypothetical protein